MNNEQRIEKEVLGGLSFYEHAPIPSIIEISPSDKCNLRCRICPKSKKGARDNELFMATSTMYMIMEDLEEMGFRGLIVFSGFGEPLLNPDIVELVRMSASKFKTDLVTNGTLLNTKLVSKLILCGINKLIVSAYSKKIESNVRELLRNVNPDFYEIRPRYQKKFKITNRGGEMGGEGIKNPCYYPSYQMMIDWNGDVLLCPQDFSRKLVFGNSWQKSLIEIWMSPKMREVRKELFEGRSKIHPCLNCDTNGCVHGKLHGALWWNAR